MDENTVDDWLHVCESAARAGGQKLLEFRARFQTREKGFADLVTDADDTSQETIRRVIAERFPDHAFIGEEPALHVSRDVGGGELAWIVDPLDGTTNYVHAYPHFAVSVGLALGKNVLVGVVYDPVADLCYSAASGRGAWCNGNRMQASRVTSAAGALVAVSLPPRVDRHSRDLLDFIEAARSCQAVRRTGSAALNFAYLARGALDAFWASQIHPWDVAAGTLLVREAGGIVTGRDGNEFDLWKPQFLAASNATLHAELLKVLTKVDT